MKKTWDSSEKWYTSCVGEKGHYYHQKIVIPNVLKYVAKSRSLLDLGCGQGVLARYLAKDVEYLGVDQSKALIQSAKKLSKDRRFIVSDVTEPLELEKNEFEVVTLILCLQNMEKGQEVVQNAHKHLKKNGKFLIVINHPCFRIPRQTSWCIDEKMKLQYRRVNAYMSEMEIPIQTSPSKGNKSKTTMSYHNPLSTYFEWLHPLFTVTKLEEWCSDKVSVGRKAKIENRARTEFPLFLALIANKGS